jgi:hypothetical protein
MRHISGINGHMVWMVASIVLGQLGHYDKSAVFYLDRCVCVYVAYGNGIYAWMLDAKTKTEVKCRLVLLSAYMCTAIAIGAIHHFPTGS